MTARFESLWPHSLYDEVFGVALAGVDLPRQVGPRRVAAFIRRAAAELPAGPAQQPGRLAGSEPCREQGGAPRGDADVEANVEVPAAPPVALGRELAVGQFGLVPRWVKSASDARLRSVKLVAVRAETVSTAHPTFGAWQAGQRCIVPVQAFLVDDMRGGKPVATRIARVDGKAMGLAGVWEHWQKDGEAITSFALLTVNANSHALMRRYGHEGAEKRMPAVLSEGGYDAWLGARPDKAREFLRAYPANWLLANPVATPQNKVPAAVRGL